MVVCRLVWVNSYVKIYRGRGRLGCYLCLVFFWEIIVKILILFFGEMYYNVMIFFLLGYLWLLVFF